MTMLANITKGYSGSSMLKWLRHNLDLILLEETTPNFVYNYTKIFINGTLIGFFDKLFENVAILNKF